MFSHSIHDSTEQDHPDDDEGYFIGSEHRINIPCLNFDKADAVDSKFSIELQLEPHLKYKGTVNYLQLQKMRKNKTIGYEKGIIVDLQRIEEESKQRGGKIGDSGRPLDVISVVIEKLPRPGSLKNHEYNAFALRRKIFQHQCSYFIEVYAPLMVVNLTQHDLCIFD